MPAAGTTRRTTTRTPKHNGDIDLTDKYSALVENAKPTVVAGTVKLGDESFRVMKAVNAVKVLRVADGDTTAVLQMLTDLMHEDDRVRFREWIDSRHDFDAEQIFSLLMDLYELAAGRPTT